MVQVERSDIFSSERIEAPQEVHCRVSNPKWLASCQGLGLRVVLPQTSHVQNLPAPGAINPDGASPFGISPAAPGGWWDWTAGD